MSDCLPSEYEVDLLIPFTVTVTSSSEYLARVAALQLLRLLPRYPGVSVGFPSEITVKEVTPTAFKRATEP